LFSWHAMQTYSYLIGRTLLPSLDVLNSLVTQLNA
jgi:hypothetical protein